MKVNEIFLSIQGESMTQGFPTIFVRFTGCNLRCSYCDTTYAYNEGTFMTPREVFDEIKKLHYKRVCLTGGEPLLQDGINELLGMLKGFSVSIETNGSVNLGNIDRNSCTFVMDMKSPSSGCEKDMLFDNFKILSEHDEIKFVISDRRDYEWAKEIIKRYYQKGIITISPVFGGIHYGDIVEWILHDRLDVRFQIQLHKVIWGAEKRGV